MPTILIVDDEKNIRATLARGLRLEGYRTSEAANGRDALSVIEDGDVDAVLLDVQMPEMDGFAMLEDLRARGSTIPVIVLTAHGTIERAVRAVKLGAYDFVEKPPSMERILLAVGNALDRHRLAEENSRLAADAGVASGILGTAAATTALREAIARVARSEAPVLLLGENGTGKEIAARAVHAASSRDKKPLVTVNCAAIPESLFESELFGHLRGAFTGAHEARRGKFQQADGGTLFLDEVGEIPLALQPKLLRALETGEVERIGGQGVERVDVRIVAATNRDLAAETEAGRFRRDLYYRLLVVPITVPTLRERIEDVPQLARHFLEHACRRNRVRVKSIAPDGLARLTRHRWPGNIRELRNAMERVAILVSGDTVEAADLSFLAAGSQVAPEPPGEAGATPSDLASQVERFERAAVLTALTRNKWKMTQTAEELGLERSHLYKKLKALGIERPADD
ncbi:MAG TPA: sigma-54 dependent transcriptional regulator [Candidatus Sulfotelmatobacter sp.]|jgi:DNA-binding NtrC family response regulator|nr:sigma-54 dependent transcriptional regulator [Candidatus Sulfotelmatobacter sp.]